MTQRDEMGREVGGGFRMGNLQSVCVRLFSNQMRQSLAHTPVLAS